MGEESVGLSHDEALVILHDDILYKLTQTRPYTSHLGWMSEAWLPGSTRSLFRLTSLGFCLLMSLALLATTSLTDKLSAGLVLTMTCVNIIISGWESYQRRLEVFKRVGRLARMIKKSREVCKLWQPEHFPHLHTPQSASLVLQWVERGGKVVNLPWSLLARGDVIIVRPGQLAPGKCCLIGQDLDLTLEQGEPFQIRKHSDKCVSPEFRNALSPQKFLLQETPYIRELVKILTSKTRPLSLLTKQRHFLITSLLELFSFPVILVVLIIWNCFRHSYSWSWLTDYPLSQMFLTEPMAVSMSLIPIMFPIWWITVNILALANVLALFRQPARLTGGQGDSNDPFDDTVETPDMEDIVPTVTWPHIWPTFTSCFLGRGEHLFRTENLLHCLGSVTSFCCTDKKGVLSWPNTSPEKIFFLKESLGHEQQDLESLVDSDLEERPKERRTVSPDILTVTHDHNNPFRIEFDDPNWRQHLPSLKPIGLSVLLNTCNFSTEENYTNFYDYLVCESAREPRLATKTDLPDLLPIPSRGCLCQLSARIGMDEQTAQSWHLEQQLQTFRPAVSDTPGNSFTRNLSLAKLKFPFPHMVSLVAREQETGRLQLLTQGTADIVLDACQDGWTGHDLSHLTEDIRKKCLEFYHRASLTSYCSAFSYRPLTSSPPWPTQSPTQYLELPAHCLSREACGEDSVDRVSLAQHDNSDNQSSPSQTSDNQSSPCLELQSNQTLLGLIQMQYQARVDMVQLIDLLEKACIRFVHFSKENELRSRVFSEKMGLESGWNCHISLASGVMDLAKTPSVMYGQKIGGKKISSLKKFSKSVPAKLGKPRSFFNFPKWSDSSKPLMGNGVSVDSQPDSGSSMLEYDMSNRAQLPAGIDNIRPHLEKMDNVPLLVSLFTDCTPSSTREMVQIMQENGEVVAVIGSSANYHNIEVFLTSDASIVVEPLYPQVCQKVPVFTPLAVGQLTPTDLARHLISVASSVSFKREEDVSLYQAIIASRRHILAIRHCIQFWASCCLFLSLVVFFSLLLVLPAPITPPQVLVISSLYIPILATASFFSAHDSNIRNISTGKNTPVSLRRSSLCRIFWCYGLRFIPPTISIILAHLLTLMHLTAQCEECSVADLESHVGLLTDSNMTFITISVVFVSLSYVSRTDHVWNYKPRRSWHIIFASIVVILIQLVYLAVKMVPDLLPVWFWIIHLGFIPVTLVVNILIKRYEIKVNVRFQKRERLEFGTKLGMNSPF